MTNLLIALGGNAIKKSFETGTSEEQLKNCEITAKSLAKIIQKFNEKDRLIITHGNGPQAGNLMVQQEEAKGKLPPHPMDVVGAMTQGQIGYMLQQSITNALKDLGIEKPVCAIVNQVLVDENDPEFFHDMASKPVGEFFTKKEIRDLKKRYPTYIFKKVKPEGEKCWRRTVPSPDPIQNIEHEAIKRMVKAGIIVIAAGGGGIPVRKDRKGHYKGVEAVIDKDLSGERLAEIVNADVFLILTDIEKVKINFGKSNEKSIDKMNLKEAKTYLEEGHFLTGSMFPKIKSCIRFLEGGGNMAIISSLDKAVEALEGKTGTIIT